MKKSNFFLILFLVAVVSIPVAYSATEPSVIINMIFGQTEKPIIVKDNVGTEIFSVDVDGTIFPEPTVAPEIEEFTVSGYPEVTVREDRSAISQNKMTISFHIDGEISLDTTGLLFANGYDDQVRIAQWRVDFAQVDECPTCNGNSEERSQGLQGWEVWETNSKNDDGSTDADGFTLWVWGDDEPTKTKYQVFGGTFTTDYEADWNSNAPADLDLCSMTRGGITGASDSCYIDLSWGVGGGDNDGTIFLKNSYWVYDFNLPQGATITKVS